MKRLVWICVCAFLGLASADDEPSPKLSEERMVFQTSFGDIEMAFYPEVAPKTYKHILKLAELGAYDTNHFFRVDKGFVAQVQSCGHGRQVPLNEEQQAEEKKHVPLEVVEGVKHYTGVISMGRLSDPDSNGSSFSILLGSAPHLDMAYTIFGRVISGMETLRKMESVETKKEGIFVMPTERITIFSSYVKYRTSKDDGTCASELAALQERFTAQELEMHRIRKKCLPGS